MERIEISYIEKGGFECKYRICPAFEQDGYRVFRKREYEAEETCTEDEIYETEEAALLRLETLLTRKLLHGLVENFKVSIKE